MRYKLYAQQMYLTGKISSRIFAYTILAVCILAAILLSGCQAYPWMTFEQDRPMASYPEQDFFQRPLAMQLPPATLRANSALRSDNTEEATYLKNIVQLLEQTKMLAANAQTQVPPQQRKVFNYSAYEIDVDTVIFAIKRYLAADDYTPRGFQALPPNRLKARYSDVE
ncbi:MAG: hypothetical protein GDA45_06340 [Chromatiales bacterium]|nr:hypothetical protein [Chromatiales bacterium]